MRADQIIQSAMALLGYADEEGNINSPKLHSVSISAVNAIYSDLYYLEKEEGFLPIGSANEEIKLSERILNDVMVYGVASFIAQSTGDSNNQFYYSQMYNEKRKKVSAKSEIQDTLPTVD